MSLQAMMEAAGAFPDHLLAGAEAVDGTPLPEGPFRNALIIGMGGSAIGGTLAGGLLSKASDIPIQVVRDHTIPGYVGEGTLVVATSYSGNTVETLDAVQDAVHRGATLVAITTGGKLGELAEQASAPTVEVPSGFQPRAALGWLFAANYGVLARILEVGDPEAPRRAAKDLVGYVEELAQVDGPAAEMAATFTDDVVGVLGHDVFGVAAERFAGQIN
ncbi:MAG: SIS domain-containing protein, partial [Candidatus Thermoplasmatota archaeon]|nr:SIS domain-containing protein [Candidatus Thermoplasmatota archaeon]